MTKLRQKLQISHIDIIHMLRYLGVWETAHLPLP